MGKRSPSGRRFRGVFRRRPSLVAALVLAGLSCVMVAAACGDTTETPPSAAAGGSAPPQATPTASRSAKPTPSLSKTKTTASANSSGPVRIVFVNVGQGDAILVQSGSHEMLVDGGPGGAADSVASAASKAGITDLDVLVVSHMHADHIGATDELVNQYDPEKAYIAGSCNSTLDSAFAASNTRVNQARRGDSFTLGSVKVRVLSPASTSGEANEDSLVLLLEVGGKRLLLAGDLTGPNESAVGGICARGPPLYLLKVAHHASRYSTSSTFLDDTDPKFAVICVGSNSYGHPTPDTISRLKAEGTRIYSTQKNGTITLTISASGAAKWQFAKSSKPVTSAGGSGGSGGSGGTTAGGSSGSSSSGSGSTVYITDTGECYHRDGCQYLSQSKIPIKLQDAKAQGYRACSVCDPPT